MKIEKGSGDSWSLTVDIEKASDPVGFHSGHLVWDFFA